MAGEAQNTPQQDVIAEEYMSSLADLTVNSKPLINMLTMLAEENVESAPVIVKVIEKHLAQVKPEMKLPVLYLVDSIVKNIGGAYTTLFTQNIVSSFCSVFEKVEESTRASMFKLRQTWSDVFPPKKLYALDVRVKSIDPAWPVTAPLPTSIHLNPAFLPKSGSAQSTKPAKPAAKVIVPVPPSDLCETEMRESLLKKQKELLELQQKKLEIELLQTKARLQQQQIQLIQTVHQTPPDVVNGLHVPEEKPLTGVPHPEIVPPLVSDAICIPEPMEIAMTPPDMSVEDEIIIPQPQITLSSPPSTHSSSRSPDKKSDPRKEKKDRDKERDKDRDREPGRKKSRKDSDKEDGRGKSKESSRSRKGKEQQQQPESVVVSEAEPVKGAPGDDEVVVVGGRTAPPSRNQPNLREAAKAMPRIPKISQRHPPSSTTGPSAPHNRDPRLMMLKSNQAERRKMDAVKKEGAGEPKKRRTNRFDDLFGNEDIDLRKAPTVPVVPAAPGVVIPPALASRESPPRGGWPHPKRGHIAPRGRGGWGGRGRGGIRGPLREGEEEQDGSGSPRNMDFILEQAKENHRNGVINDGEYSTIIRQVFQMSETKMIREVQRRESFPGPAGPPGPPGPPIPPGPPGPHPHPEHDFRYAGRDMPPGPYGPEMGRDMPPGPYGPGPGPEPDRGWNDPRRGGGYPYPPMPGRMQRFDMMQPPRHLGPPGPPGMIGPMNSAFEVRLDEDMKTIPIDNVPREIRFYGDKAIILMAAEDPRLLGFQPCVRRVLLENVPIDCTVGNDYMDFHFDGQLHKIKIGAPTRELYIDGNWYECMFGGPPITVNIGGRPVQAILEGPPPTVKIGTERRLDLLAGRVTMIIDAHSVIPVYLDLKLQHFEMDGKIFTLQFKDALRTAVIDGNPYRVDFGGLPMAIHLDGRKHFVRFSSLPRGVEPGRVLQPLPQGEENVIRRVVEEEKAPSQTPPLGQLNIGELLSKLVATGLLPGSTPEVVKPSPVKEEVKKEEVRVVNLGDTESMKIRPNAMIALLYSGMQCGSCGLRFPADQTVRYSTHLDWHFRQNRREKGASKRPQSRKWYCSVADWIQFEETEGSDEKRLNWFETQAKEKSEKEGDRNGEDFTPEENTSVPVGSAPEENKCFVCHEELDQFFHEESEEWHLKDAVRAEGITFHRLCYRDYLANTYVGAYSPSDAIEEYKSASDDEKTGSEEEKSTTDDDKVISGEDEPVAETNKMEEMPADKCEPMDSQDTVPADPCVEVPVIKSEPPESEPMLQMITEDQPVFSAIKTEVADTEVPFDESKIERRIVEMNLQNSVKSEPLDETEKECLDSESSLETGPVIFDQLNTEKVFTGMLQDEVQMENESKENNNIDLCLDSEEMKDKSMLLDIPNEIPDVLKSAEVINAVEVPEKVECDSVSIAPQVENDVECRDTVLNEEAASIPNPLLTVVQTPTVVSSLDGNVEVINKQPAPAPAGIKIKINLFNKASSALSTLPSSPPTPSLSERAATSVPVQTPENSSEPLNQTLDESALTNKPRLVGRKLTVLPVMTKGVETSGLCSIM